MKPVANLWSCRNPGQTALLWAWQPAPFGHGWIDVKAGPLVRLSDVEALCKDAERYRYLRSGKCSGHEENCATVITDDQSAWYREDLDHLIDRQMADFAEWKAKCEVAP